MYLIFQIIKINDSTFETYRKKLTKTRSFIRKRTYAQWIIMRVLRMWKREKLLFFYINIFYYRLILGHNLHKYSQIVTPFKYVFIQYVGISLRRFSGIS